MKRSDVLPLLEQSVMLAVFLVSAALCLGLFAWADAEARGCRALDGAVHAAQNAVEALKASGGDETTLQTDGRYEVRVTKEGSTVPGLGLATVSVLDEAGETLFSLPAAWQEVAYEP